MVAAAGSAAAAVVVVAAAEVVVAVAAEVVAVAVVAAAVVVVAAASAIAGKKVSSGELAAPCADEMGRALLHVPFLLCGGQGAVFTAPGVCPLRTKAPVPLGRRPQLSPDTVVSAGYD